MANVEGSRPRAAEEELFADFRISFNPRLIVVIIDTSVFIVAAQFS